MTLHQTTPTPAASSPAATRARELETGRLVLRALREGLGGGTATGFLLPRATQEVAAMGAGPARHALGRALESLGPSAEAPGAGDFEALAAALVCYGGVLERHHQLGDAVDAYDAALAARPEDPELMLHAARVRRKAGEREAALALYRRVRERGDSRLARFSALGEALLEETPLAALATVVADAEAAGDREVAAVALEERARLRRAAGHAAGAVRDCSRAALLFEDRRDRLRIAHALADLLLARGDLDGAREALSAAAEIALEEERHLPVQRLRAIARLQGDQIGLRRWPPASPVPLVGLMPAAPRGPGPGAPSFAGELRRWRRALTGR